MPRHHLCWLFAAVVGCQASPTEQRDDEAEGKSPLERSSLPEPDDAPESLSDGAKPAASAVLRCTESVTLEGELLYENEWAFDSAHRPVEKVHAITSEAWRQAPVYEVREAHVERWRYDAEGRLTRWEYTSDRGVSSGEHIFDEQGRLVREVFQEAGFGHERVHSYDAAGRKVEIRTTYENGVVSLHQWIYSGDRLVQERRGEPNQWAMQRWYTYDGEQLLEVIHRDRNH